MEMVLVICFTFLLTQVYSIAINVSVLFVFMI